jgi:FkbM family methyltransferase
MQKLRILLFVFTSIKLCAIDGSFKFEGILGSPVEDITNMNSFAQWFLPYNPVVVEIGASAGLGSLRLGQSYPYGTVFVFEPQLKLYLDLVENMKLFNNVFPVNLAVSNVSGDVALWGEGINASQIPFLGAKKINVPGVVLDQWCKQNDIDHIDFLRLDVGGMEGFILASSPEIIKTILVIVTKTYLQPANSTIYSFAQIKQFLEMQGFELLGHWYQEGKEGEATFVRRYMYDALFR